MNATFTYENQTYPLRPLELVQILSDRYGITDLDVDGDAQGGRATVKGGSLLGSGATLEAACEHFIRQLLKGGK